LSPLGMGKLPLISRYSSPARANRVEACPGSVGGLGWPLSGP